MAGQPDLLKSRGKGQQLAYPNHDHGWVVLAIGLASLCGSYAAGDWSWDGDSRGLACHRVYGSVLGLEGFMG